MKTKRPGGRGPQIGGPDLAVSLNGWPRIGSG